MFNYVIKVSNPSCSRTNCIIQTQMGAGTHNQEGQCTSGVQMRGGGMYSSGCMGGVRTTGEQQQIVMDRGILMPFRGFAIS